MFTDILCNCSPSSAHDSFDPSSAMLCSPSINSICVLLSPVSYCDASSVQCHIIFPSPALLYSLVLSSSYEDILPLPISVSYCPNCLAAHFIILSPTLVYQITISLYLQLIPFSISYHSNLTIFS